MTLDFSGINFIILSIVAIFIGQHINHKIPFLEKSNIPKAVTGGLLFSLGFGIAEYFSLIDIQFDMKLRNILLLVFFSSVGLSAKLRVLIAGGKSLILLLIPAVILLFLQDGTGVLICKLFGDEPIHGLFAGSIPLAGGHGTAIAWGTEATKHGFEYAESIGISFATFGLILGGLVGCPLATWLIQRNGLTSTDNTNNTYLDNPVHIPNMQLLPSIEEMLKTLLLISISINVGLWLNSHFAKLHILIPNFVAVMLISIIITNCLDGINRSINDESIDISNGVSLEVFLAMSLIAIKFSSFSYHFLQMSILMAVQVVLITFFTIFVVFRLLGRDYDAAVISSGLVGLGLGATPVAIGNMQSITDKFGPSSKAFLIVPLVGAFFIDIANTIVLKIFLSFMENSF